MGLFDLKVLDLQVSPTTAHLIASLLLDPHLNQHPRPVKHGQGLQAMDPGKHRLAVNSTGRDSPEEAEVPLESSHGLKNKQPYNHLLEEKIPSKDPEPQLKNPYFTDSCHICRVGSVRELSRTKLLEIRALGSDNCWACAGIRRFLVLQSEATSSELLEVSGSTATYFTKKPLNGPRDVSSSIMLGFDPSPATSSLKAFSTLNKWIKKCDANHERCRENGSVGMNKTLPHRILKIEAMGSSSIRLVENDPSTERYACLSYRWGPDTRKTSLTWANLAVYRERIPDHCIYPLIRDAITATSRVGLRYLWIDSFCIVQDDELDWHREAACMGDIYENAFITLSSTTANDTGRLFSELDPLKLGYPITKIGQTPVFIRRELYHPAVPGYGLQDPEHMVLPHYSLKQYTLSRGWIFQERILSRRFVHFLKDELFWECRQSTWCECRSREEEWRTRRARYPRAVEELDWSSSIRDYCQTTFTYERDRAQALSGVARRYGDFHHKTFLAGMWLEDLPRTFLWDQEPIYRWTWSSHIKPRPLHCTPASWSWTSLSVQGELPAIVHLDQSPCDLYFWGFSRYPDVADVYSDYHSVRLTLAGPMVRAFIFPEEGCVKVLGVP